MIALRIMAVALWLLSGCASSQGLDPKPLNELLRYEEERFIGEQPLTSVAASPLRLTALKLGLYLNPTGFFKREFEWTDGDRETVLTWANGLHASGVVSSASLVTQSSVRGNLLAELRGSAARYGADLLLIIDGAASIDRYNNYKASLLYWTILGAYLVDGTHSDALCLLRGSVWDVKTGTQLFTDDAQATARQIGPAARVQDRTTVSEACRQALTQLLTTLKNRLTRPQNP
jgi:rhombotail lipoprotein